MWLYLCSVSCGFLSGEFIFPNSGFLAIPGRLVSCRVPFGPVAVTGSTCHIVLLCPLPSRAKTVYFHDNCIMYNCRHDNCIIYHEHWLIAWHILQKLKYLSKHLVNNYYVFIFNVKYILILNRYGPIRSCSHLCRVYIFFLSLFTVYRWGSSGILSLTRQRALKFICRAVTQTLSLIVPKAILSSKASAFLSPVLSFSNHIFYSELNFLWKDKISKVVQKSNKLSDQKFI